MPLNHLSSKSSLASLLLVCLLAACYLAINLRHGWVPHDEGILGQAAERVLKGELPHCDFNEPYTGGLAYLDAAAFRLFAVNLTVLRYVLLVFFILWVFAVFAIFCELCPAWIAAAAALLCVAWSVPNYPAAMPSWFCLFFATFGVMAVLFYLRTDPSYWLVFSGLCGGCSCLVKTAGLFFVAGVLLLLVYREQTLSREFGGEANRTLLFRAFHSAGPGMLFARVDSCRHARRRSFRILAFCFSRPDYRRVPAPARAPFRRFPQSRSLQASFRGMGCFFGWSRVPH